MLIVLLLPGLLMLGYVGFVLRSAWFFGRIAPANAAAVHERPRLSVVIPARNEGQNLALCLGSLAKQRYPNFEVWVIDDGSTDNTAAIASQFAQADTRFHLLTNPPIAGIAHKKAAVTHGIRHATGSIIVQTDADCVAGPDWLATVAAHFDAETALVSAPVCLLPAQDGLLPSALRVSTQQEPMPTGWSRLLQMAQQFEYAGLMALGGGGMAGGTPNMCNGANLAYRKSAFEAIGGFSAVDTFASGDDEMLLQKLHAAGFRQRFVRSFAAVVYSPAMPNWPALKRQRLRWVSKARFYPNRSLNLIQLMSYGAFAGVPALLLAGIWWPQAWALLALNLALKTAADAWLMTLAARLLRRPYLLRYLLPMQVLYVAYVLWVGLAGNLVRSYEWKGRLVR